MEWRQTYTPDGDVSPLDNVVLHNGKMYWVHIQVISRDVPICSHLLYWIEVMNNKWGFHIILQSHNTRCVCLAVHSNKIICFMNDGATTVRLIEDTTNESAPTFSANLSRNSSQDGDGFRWSLICSLTLDINMKSPTCFPISAIDNCMLMCKYSGVEFFFYDITNAFYDDVTIGGEFEYTHS